MPYYTMELFSRPTLTSWTKTPGSSRNFGLDSKNIFAWATLDLRLSKHLLCISSLRTSAYQITERIQLHQEILEAPEDCMGLQSQMNKHKSGSGRGQRTLRSTDGGRFGVVAVDSYLSFRLNEAVGHDSASTWV